MSATEVSESELNWPRAWRAAGVIALVVLALYVLSRIPLTVEIFIVGTLVAYGINPIVRRLGARIPRLAAVTIVYVALTLAVLLLFFVVVPDTVAQLQTFFANSSGLTAALQNTANSVQAWIAAHLGSRVLPVQLQSIETNLLAQLTAGINNIVSRAGNALLGIASGIVVGITAIVLSFFFLTHSLEIRASLYSLFPGRHQATAANIEREIARVIGGFVFGQIVLCLFVGITTWIVLTIAGSQYALLLGALSGVLYALPFLGLIVSVVLGVLLGSLQGWTMAIITAITIAVVSKIADIILVPKVMGESVGVSPMAVIFAIFAGGELFGVWGLVLAIPAAALVKIAWNLWIHPWITGASEITT